VVLTAQNHMMLYIPEGFAHGFHTLEDNTEVFYQRILYALIRQGRALGRSHRWHPVAS
jgi:dTDP-4-dehydrorhamnose 3,5-epimerase